MKRAIAAALGLMRAANLATYGNWPADSAGLSLMVEAYAMALEGTGAEPQDVEQACRRFVARGGQFPDSGAFARECLRCRSERVQRVGVEVDGALRIEEVPVGSREALPETKATPEQVAELEAKLAALGVRLGVAS